MDSMPKYASYKDSGVEWLGKLPTEWDLVANKHIFNLKKNLVGKRSSEYELLSLTLKGIIKRDMENPEGKFPAEFDTYQKVNVDDFVFCLFDVEETPRTVGLSSYDGMITGAYTVFDVKPEYEPRFLYYFYLNLDASKRLKPLYKGLRNTISKDAFLSFKTFVPARDGQRAIADFLDQKTAQIDEAIAIKEQQIALLKERKQIIIQQAVTQGLDPNVPMKDSGVDWIGKIPEHWEAKRFKYLAKVRYGLGQPPKALEGGLKIIRATNVERGKIVEKGMLYVDPKDIPWDRNPELREGEIIVVRSGAYTGDSALVTKEYDRTIAGYDMVATPTNCYPNFLSNALLSKYVLFDQIYLHRMRSAQPHLNAEELNELWIAVPPHSEQVEISNYLSKVDDMFESTTRQLSRQIANLKEYKTTLINSAVTGKIKVA